MNLIWNQMAIALTLVGLAAGQGAIHTAADVPPSCNCPDTAYVQLHVDAQNAWLSNRQHDTWTMEASVNGSDTRYVLGHSVFGHDEPWQAQRDTTGNDTAVHVEPYLNLPVSRGGGGWILGKMFKVKGQPTEWTDPFGVCPGKATDVSDSRMILWRCSKRGTFPNFYAVTMDKEQDFVFFDIDARTYRLFVSAEDATVRWQECIKAE